MIRYLPSAEKLAVFYIIGEKKVEESDSFLLMGNFDFSIIISIMEILKAKVAAKRRCIKKEKKWKQE